MQIYIGTRQGRVTGHVTDIEVTSIIIDGIDRAWDRKNHGRLSNGTDRRGRAAPAAAAAAAAATAARRCRDEDVLAARLRT